LKKPHEPSHSHSHGHDHGAHGAHGAHAGHAGHDHAAGADERSLKIALGLTSAFLLVELAGGILTRSLALLSDAAHMFTDVMALAIALVAIHIGKRAADSRRTFGYARFEILAAAANAMLLFGAAVYIVFEAYLRLKSPPDIQPTGMPVIAIVGLVVNLLAMRALAGGKDGSLNVKGAYLEVWSDMLGSLGVIVGAIVIQLTGYAWVDSLVAVLIGLWVVPRTWSLLKSSVNILLEGVPDEIELEAVRGALLAVPGVVSLHDLHVWALSSGKVSLTAHVVNDPGVDAERVVLPAIRDELKRHFRITHVTVQCELTPCGETDEDHHFRR
jgi:cobalt-zinc-cadmium efflux system protein